VLSLIVGVTNAILYAGFHMTILIAHLDDSSCRMR
jgi:hypothetical protein